MVVDVLRGEALFNPQVNQEFLNGRGGNLLDDLALEVGHNIFGGVVVERYCFGLALPIVNTDGIPFFPHEPGEVCFCAVNLAGLDALRVV